MKKRLNFLLLAVLFLAILWAGKGIFKYNVASTHDGNHHLARSFDALATIKEGHFPLRWAGSLNYECGVPIYNFFYPLIYYLVIILNFVGWDIIFSLKIINFLSLFIGTLFFYLWVKSEINDKLAALAGAILYLYAPYRFLLIFVRGSPEFLAYAILPMVLYFFSLAFKIKSQKKFLILSFLAALSGGLLTIAHNFTVMFLMPIILLCLLIKIFKTKPNIKRVFLILFAYLSAFGLGAFFIGPALLEKKYTKIGDNFLQWREHFPTLWQVVRSKWGYFYSSFGTQNDGMSFQLGYAHWLVLGLVGIWFIYQIMRRKKIKIEIAFFGLISLGSLFLVLPWSIFIWERIPLLQEVQFSWRLLGLSVFGISALFGFWLAQVKNRQIYFALLILVSTLAIIGNRNHLLPQPVSVEDLYRYEDFEKLHPHRHSTTTLGDDVIAPNAPQACWFTTEIVETEKQEKIPYEVVEKANTRGAVNLLLEKNKLEGQKIVLKLGYFPRAFNLEVNGKDVSYEDCQGRVCLAKEVFQEGPNHIYWQVKQTPTQSLFNFVTLTFLAFWLGILVVGLTKFKIKLFHIWLLFIFAVFAFLRFYHLPQRIGFGWDEERDARAVGEILNGDLKLIGPRVLSDTGFFLAPYFFYLLAPFYAFSRLSPYATVYFSVFYNLTFFIISFLVLKKLFSQKVALLFLAFWAVNPHTLSFDTGAWNPVLIPLAFMVFLYLLAKPKGFFLGFIWGLGISFHVQFLLLAPMFIPLLRKDKKKLVNVLLGFILSFAPLILFDLKNNFLNLRLINDFLLTGGTRNYFSFLPVWDNVAARIFGLPPSRVFAIFFYLLVAGALYIQRKKPIWQGFFYTWVFFPFPFAFYGKRPSEYYFNFSLIIVGLTFAHFVNFKNKLFLLATLSLLVYFGFEARPQLNTARLGLYQKDKVAQFVSRITKDASPFNLSYRVGLSQDVGFRYLFGYRGVKVSGNDLDPLMEVVIPPTGSTFEIGPVGLEIPAGWMNANWVKEKN